MPTTGAADRSAKVLVIDVGGTNVKVLVTGEATRRKFPSGPKLTPRQMVKQVKALTKDWTYDVISIGVPGPVRNGQILREPTNLGRGWRRFDFRAALGRPIRLINDAAMQALGSYQGGSMLFLGFGTGLGTTLIVDQIIQPLELAHLDYRRATYEDYVGLRGLLHRGKKRWRRHVHEVTQRLGAAFLVDDLVLGGGNAKLIGRVPAGARLSTNANAFVGGFRLWGEDPSPGAMPETPKSEGPLSEEKKSDGAPKADRLRRSPPRSG